MTHLLYVPNFLIFLILIYLLRINDIFVKKHNEEVIALFDISKLSMFSANTIVSMKTVSYFKKSGLDVSLVFPGRDKVKSDKNQILDFYNIKEEINVVRTSYFSPVWKN